MVQKYIVGEIVLPQDLWPDIIIRYAIALLENKSWKAYLIGNHGGSTEVPFYSNQNVPLGQSMIELVQAVALYPLHTGDLVQF